MNTIKGKLYLIYGLITIAILVTILSSYVAIDTNNQHLMLTELLKAQEKSVDEISLITGMLSDIRVYDEDLFQKQYALYKATIEEHKYVVEDTLDQFISREYRLGGDRVTLKFKGEFAVAFDQALFDAQTNWSKVQMDIENLLINSKTDEYKIYVENFESMNFMFEEDIFTISKLCRDEADKQKITATTLQNITIGIVLFIFLWLIIFLRNDFQKPMFKLSEGLKKVSNGDYKFRLTRHKSDEFTDVFNDFNRFLDNNILIRHIEDHILNEDSLLVILKEMVKDFKPFVELQTIEVAYKDSFENYTRIDAFTSASESVENLIEYEEITCVDDVKLILPIRINQVYLGYGTLIKETPFSRQEINFVSSLEQKIAFALYKSLIFKDLLQIVTTGLADLTESRDPETKRHLVRMSMYAQVIAEDLHSKGQYQDIIDYEFIEHIKLVAPMHDIGKVAVPDHILLKPGKLTDEEFDQMKKHTCEGARVLTAIDKRFSTYNIHYFKMAEDIAHYHQEKFNGSGYPEHIEGETIPLSARICAVADVFDALTSKRPYKDAFSLEKSYDIIKSSIGSHFDPTIVDAFFNQQERIEAIYYKYREV